MTPSEGGDSQNSDGREGNSSQKGKERSEMELPSDVSLCRARARDPAWLLALSGSDTTGGGNHHHAAQAGGAGAGGGGGVSVSPLSVWCSLCLRAEGDDRGAAQDLAGAPRCCSGAHAFCRRCFDVCGGRMLEGASPLLLSVGRCPLCRLCARAGGFGPLVAAAEPFAVLDPPPGWDGAGRLLLRESFGAEERCEMAHALAADRARALRSLMCSGRGRSSRGPISRGHHQQQQEDEEEEEGALGHDPTDVGSLVGRLGLLLPSLDDLPPSLLQEAAVVSNSSSLLGRGLGPSIDQHPCVVRFNEFVRGRRRRKSRDGGDDVDCEGEDFSGSVGSRTTCHVISEQVAQSALSDSTMLEALRETPLTLWMPPLAWGNTSYYARYARLLLGAGVDGLDLSQEQRGRVALLRPGASFSLWKYFGNLPGGPGAGTTGFKFALLALGMSESVWLYGFEDDDRNEADPVGGHYFDRRHAQEQSYDFAWERKHLRRLEADGVVRLVPSHITT